MNIKAQKQKEFQPGRGYTKEDWDEVSDNPPWTEEELRSARPFREVFPEITQGLRQELAQPDG